MTPPPPQKLPSCIQAASFCWLITRTDLLSQAAHGVNPTSDISVPDFLDSRSCRGSVISWDDFITCYIYSVTHFGVPLANENNQWLQGVEPRVAIGVCTTTETAFRCILHTHAGCAAQGVCISVSATQGVCISDMESMTTLLNLLALGRFDLLRVATKLWVVYRCDPILNHNAMFTC